MAYISGIVKSYARARAVMNCVSCNWDEWAGNDEGYAGDELLKFVDQTLFPRLGNLDLSAYRAGSTAARRALLVHGVFANNYNYMKSGIHLRQVINKLNEIDFNNSKDKHVSGQIYETFLSELQSVGTLGEFYTLAPLPNGELAEAAVVNC